MEKVILITFISFSPGYFIPLGLSNARVVVSIFPPNFFFLFFLIYLLLSFLLNREWEEQGRLKLYWKNATFCNQVKTAMKPGNLIFIWFSSRHLANLTISFCSIKLLWLINYSYSNSTLLCSTLWPKWIASFPLLFFKACFCKEIISFNHHNVGAYACCLYNFQTCYTKFITCSIWQIYPKLVNSMKFHQSR